MPHVSCLSSRSTIRHQGTRHPGIKIKPQRPHLDPYDPEVSNPASHADLRPLGLTSDQFVAAGFGPLEAYSGLFRRGELRCKHHAVELPPIVRELREDSPEGEVIKFVLRVPGIHRPGNDQAKPPPPLETESVLIPMIGKTRVPTHTLCVSSQVGCAMGCTFCETAQMGLMRSLLPEEIVAQWFTACHVIGIRPKNVVFMGMGEPMDNLDNVLQAIAVLTDRRGPEVPMSKITVSTVGHLDGLRRLARQVEQPGWHRLNLAVSVNAPNDEIRDRLMPINRAMPMDALREALLAWPKYGSTKICLEYVLIPGVNDAREHAIRMADWARPLPACVNVIPYNPRRNSPWPAPSEERVAEFLAWLTEAGAYAKRRRTKGRRMMGACGQLGNEQIRQRQWVPVAIGPTL